MTAIDLTLNTADAENTRRSHAATYAGLIHDNMIVAWHVRPDYEALARDNLMTLCDLLGFVAMPKADHLALTGFVEDIRDHKPAIISGRAHDPQDDLPDFMEADEFLAFQHDAAKLIPRMVKIGEAA